MIALQKLVEGHYYIMHLTMDLYIIIFIDLLLTLGCILIMGTWFYVSVRLILYVDTDRQHNLKSGDITNTVDSQILLHLCRQSYVLHYI